MLDVGQSILIFTLMDLIQDLIWEGIGPDPDIELVSHGVLFIVFFYIDLFFEFIIVLRVIFS